MELRRGENLFQTFIVAADADVKLATGTKISDLVDTEIAVFAEGDADSVALTNSATAAAILSGNPKTNYFIAQNVGGSILKSASFNYGDIVNQSYKAYSASSNQSTWIGYNGSSFDFPTVFTAGDSLWLTLIMQNPNERDRSQPFRRYAQTVAQTGALGGITVASDLVNNLNKSLNLEAEANKTLLVELSSAASLATANDFVTNVAVVNGSKYLTHTTNANYATSTALAVGDYIRFAAAGTGGTVALTDHVYKVVELVSATVTKLDRPVTSVASQTFAFASAANCEVIPAATAIAASCAIKITGTDNQFDLVRYRNYYKNRFVVSASEDFGAVSIYTPTKASEGSGEYEQVAMNEYMSWGYEGQPIMDNILPGQARTTTASTTGTYNSVNVSIDKKVSHLVGGGSLKANLLFYLDVITANAGSEALVAFLTGTDLTP